MNIIIGPLLQIMIVVIDMYTWVVIIGVVLSWLVAFNVINSHNKFVYMVGDFTHRLTEPALGRIRGILPNLGGLDLSPVVLILGLIFLQNVIQNVAYSLVR